MARDACALSRVLPELRINDYDHHKLYRMPGISQMDVGVEDAR